MKKRVHQPYPTATYAIFGVFFILIAALFIMYQPKQFIRNTKLDTGELVESQPAALPQDVSEYTKKQILGAAIPGKVTSVPALFHVPILMFHYVEYVQDKGDTIRISLNTPPYLLEEEIKTLMSAHYMFITNAQLADAMNGKSILPQNPIVLTFDDGYRDFYTDAYPILKKYHVKATEYVISGLLDRANYMTTDMIRTIANDGLVEIGAHTMYHPALKGMVYDKVVNEITRSKDMLENLINKPVVSFAYPYGSFDVQAMLIAQNSGFTSSVSTLPGIDQSQINKFFLYRLRSGGRVGDNLLTWLQSVKNN